MHRTIKWIKVPSHVGIQGNEEADSPAEDGRLRSPLLRQSVAPKTRNLCCLLAPQWGAGLPPRPERITISVSESESSTSEQSLPSSPYAGQAQDVTQKDMAATSVAAAPIMPHPPAHRAATTHTPSPRFLSLADSPAARLLSALYLQVLFSPANILSAGGNSPLLLHCEAHFSDSASDQSTVSVASTVNTEVSMPQKRRRHIS